MSNRELPTTPPSLLPTPDRGGSLVRTGGALVVLSDALRTRLLALALAFTPLMCALAVAVAIARDREQSLMATVLIAATLAGCSVWALRRPTTVLRALRRGGAWWLAPIALALAAFAADGAAGSTMYFPAVTAVAPIAVAADRRTALLAGTILAGGWFGGLWALGYSPAVLLDAGLLPTVVGEAASFPLWGLLLAGMTERFALFTLHINRLAAPDAPHRPERPLRVPNLAGTPMPAAPRAAGPGADEAPLERRAHDLVAVTSSGLDALTSRQLEVIALLRDGLGATQIAQRLGIKEATVYRHVEHAKRRLGVTSRHDLVVALVHAEILPAQQAE